MRFVVALAAISLVVTLGCSSNNGTVEPAGTFGFTVDPILGRCPPVIASEPIDVGPVTIDGDLLTVGVEFSGGCAHHDFRLCWDGFLIDTLPPTAVLHVIHDDGGDSCRAALGVNMVVDVSELADAGGPIRIQVENWSVLYEP